MSYELLEELENKIVDWGLAKGILGESEDTLKQRQLAQFSKTLEEMTELGDAIQDENYEEACDAIGDIIVTLIMQTRLWNTDLQSCLSSVYDIISKRTGKMIDGVFVKDE